MKNGVPQPSQEREGHGYGVQNVIRCAEKYNGVCNFDYDNEKAEFQAVLLIPV
ncbi:MAG: GHKL domain-containing protein [Peptococcaceae bacterium]|nr:GHKL domain-containing protein [Peptococcaceae bacterium]